MSQTCQFTYIKTPLMTLIAKDQEPALSIDLRYYPVIESARLTVDELISLLSKQFPESEIDQQFFDYVVETRLIEARGKQIICMPLEHKIFNQTDVEFILIKEGEYELVKQDRNFYLGLQRYYYADYHGETIKKISVTQTQIEQWLISGKAAIDEYVEQQRLQLWHYQPIWLVIIKAKLESAVCSIAFDGSDFYVVYACVPADSADEARQKAVDYLTADYLSAETIYDIKPFNLEDFSNKGEFATDILEQYNRAHITQKTRSFSFSPGCMTSFLITPYATILSKWHCDYAFWSKRTKEIEFCEFFPDATLCFERLIELNKLTQSDLDEFMKLDDGEGREPIHYRLLPEGKKRFEKIQRSFELDGDLMIDWEDWHYDFYKRGEDYFLWIYLGGIADRTVEIKLADYQADRYEREGISYIRELIRKI